MPIRCFTTTLANRTLPLVRRIVEDILRKGRELRHLATRSENNQRELERLGEEIRLHIEELTQIGCEYKDWSFDVGIVDFPARLDGKPIFLCWRSDEARVTHYHRPESGIAGRRKLPAHALAAH